MGHRKMVFFGELIMFSKKFVCVSFQVPNRSGSWQKMAFFWKNLKITFIYNKLIKIIRNNKFIDESLILNNKSTTSIFENLPKTNFLNLDSKLDSNLTNFLNLDSKLDSNFLNGRGINV